MPNKRSENKEYLSTWIDADLKEKLKRISKEQDVSMSEMVNLLIKEEVAEYMTKADKQKGSSDA